MKNEFDSKVLSDDELENVNGGINSPVQRTSVKQQMKVDQRRQRTTPGQKGTTRKSMSSD